MQPVVLPVGRDAILYTGVVDVSIPAIVSECLREPYEVFILLGGSRRELEGWLEDVQFFVRMSPDPPALQTAFFPLAPEDAGDAHAFEDQCDRLAALALLADEPSAKSAKRLLAMNPTALFQACPPVASLRSAAVFLRTGEHYDFAGLARQFAEVLGYDMEAVCERPGQFAVRGGLIDVYPLHADGPVRLDFFGGELESIRPFDPTTQRSDGSLDSVRVTPAGGGVLSNEKGSLLDHLPPRVLWIVAEPSRLAAAEPTLFNRPEHSEAPAANFSHLLPLRPDDGWRGLAAVDSDPGLFSAVPRIERYTESLDPHAVYQLPADFGGVVREDAEQRSRRELLKLLGRWSSGGDDIHIVTRSPSTADRIAELMRGDDLAAALQARYSEGSLAHGFRWKRADGKGEVFVTENEILGRNRLRIPARRRRLPEHAKVDHLLDFSELSEGDHLVHLEHGICIFRGLSVLELDGRDEEVLSLEFDEGMVLHLRLHESHLLSRYVGLAKTVPRLGRVGGSQWSRARREAERATLDFAAELLRLQAQREALPGHAFSPDQPWQKAFEDAFPHEETADQQLAIEACKRDLEQGFPMDRLLCGDVGFGKTEVAIRAAFKVVMDGKQAALLAPTTVLCQQHFNTLRERFAGYPIVVDMLSRFRKPAEKQVILEQLRSGRIDILVGTHAMLSRDVHFADLGLLVIDEEHRFGVRHKEKLKQIRQGVDVLSLSATPIPRTLQYALMGARTLSVIETPPRDRLPIETIVRGYDPNLVQRAIQHEINRGGQVFYLHNRVDTIEGVADGLRRMLPGVRVAVGHGQMGESRLERVMTDFVAGRHQVLVCTTIIESGLDIPNCNTLIIEGADRFGLSQLYQIRGRVGRFNRQAYAYLLLHRHTHLAEKARKRLGALRQFNQLGAGFRIAMRDLELRGAGNLLGARQSGHIAGVGFDVYCQLLRRSVARLKGDTKALRVAASVQLDFVRLAPPGQSDSKSAQNLPATASVDSGFAALKQCEPTGQYAAGTIHAHLPQEYINEATLRIEFHRKLAMALTLDEVERIAADLMDRFGKLPSAVNALLMMSEIRILAEQNELASVQTEGERLKCRRAYANKEGNRYIQTARRFPRLTKRRPLDRLMEIKQFLLRLSKSTV